MTRLRHDDRSGVNSARDQDHVLDRPGDDPVRSTERPERRQFGMGDRGNDDRGAAVGSVNSWLRPKQPPGDLAVPTDPTQLLVRQLASRDERVGTGKRLGRRTADQAAQRQAARSRDGPSRPANVAGGRRVPRSPALRRAGPPPTARRR